MDKGTLEYITECILDSHAGLGGIRRNLDLFRLLWCIPF
jgi:hypothetical protein